MLHIILGILKIIGIVLGILLLLLQAAVLAVILVPVRYQIQAKKQEDEVCAGIKVSWLLHIVSASFKINKRAEHDIAIRLFGIRLPLFGTKKKKKRVKRRAVPAKVREPEDVPEPEEVLTEEDSLEDDTSGERYGVLEDEYVSEDEDVPIGENISERDSDIPGNEYASEDEVVPADADASRDDFLQPSPDEIQPGQDDMSGDTKVDTEDDMLDDAWEDARDDMSDDTEKVSGSGKIRFSFQGICDKIKAVYGWLKALIRRLFSVLKKLWGLVEKVGELPQKIGDLFEKAGEMSEKIGEFAQKPGQLLELAERLEAREVLRDVFGYLTYLLRHYAPRSIRGFLKFGTGDPSVTGQLTGLIYLILPARADHFTVQPEFGDAVLETEISCKGHIRAVHLIRVLWWGFRNKKLRRIIRYRNRG